MFRLHILGAGTPTPSSKRFGTCYIVETKEDLLMFDCGPAATYKMTRMGLNPTKVNYLFFSHHHFDHNSDFPCFLLSRWDQAAGKGEALKVYGPPPTKQFADRLIGKEGAFFLDWQARVQHPGSQEIYQKRGGKLPRKPPIVDVEEIDTGRCIMGKNWQVTGVRVKHIEPWMPTLAYRIEHEDTSLVITSDTGFCQSVINLSIGADCLLIHCWDIQKRMSPVEASMITGTVEAAEIAVRTGTRRLLLSHINPNIDQLDNRKKASDDVKRIYKGSFDFVDELSTIEIGKFHHKIQNRKS